MKRKNSIISITLATLLLVSLCTVCVSTSLSAAGGTSSATVQPPAALVGNPIPVGTGPSLIISGNYMYIFVKGYDGALWYNRNDLVTPNLPNWGWSGWMSLGVQLSSSPCAVSRQAGIIDVYMRGTDGALWYMSYQSGSGWSGWEPLGGVCTSSPAAVTG